MFFKCLCFLCQSINKLKKTSYRAPWLYWPLWHDVPGDHADSTERVGHKAAAPGRPSVQAAPHSEEQNLQRKTERLKNNRWASQTVTICGKINVVIWSSWKCRPLSSLKHILLWTVPDVASPVLHPSACLKKHRHQSIDDRSHQTTPRSKKS